MGKANSIIQKAHFDSKVDRIARKFSEKLEAMKDFLQYNKDNCKELLRRYEKTFCSNFLLGYSGIIDSAFMELMIEIIYCYPYKIEFTEKSKVKIWEVGTINGLTRTFAEEKAHELAYKSFSDQVNYILQKDTNKIRQDILDNVVEIRETRNLIAHGERKYNAIYRLKAGRLDRGCGRDIDIVCDTKYIDNAIAYIKNFLIDLFAAIRDKYTTFSRADALKELWDNSYLGKLSHLTPFEKMWQQDIEGDTILRYRPTELLIERSKILSHSEKLLMNFFFIIYNGNKSIYLQE